MTAPSTIDLDLYGDGFDHSRCADEGAAYGGAYCLATRKPGPCLGQHRPGTILTPPKPIAVPNAPSQADAAKIAAMRMQDPAYRAAYLKAEQVAQSAGVGRGGHASLAGPMHDYAHALRQHGMAEQQAQTAYTNAQRAHDNAAQRSAAQQAAFAAREKAAEAKAAAAQARARLHHAARRKAGGTTPFPMGGMPMMAGDTAAYALGEDDGGAYALVGEMHMACLVGEFCRNPLHPGPCKGWKHMLHSVSPGAYHAYERRRIDQLNAKREARVQHLKTLGHPVPAHLTKPIPYPTGGPSGPAPSGFHPPTPDVAKAALPRTASQIGQGIAARRGAAAAAQATKIDNQAQALAGVTQALGAAGANVGKGNVDTLKQNITKIHGLVAPGDKLTDHPAMKATIDHLADEAVKVGNLDPKHKQDIADEIAAHVESGSPGLPPLVTSAINNGKKVSAPSAPNAPSAPAAPARTPGHVPSAPAAPSVPTASGAVPAHVQAALDVAHGRRGVDPGGQLLLLGKLAPADYAGLSSADRKAVVDRLASLHRSSPVWSKAAERAATNMGAHDDLTKALGGTAAASPDPASSLRIQQAVRVVTQAAQHTDPQRLAAYDQLTKDDVQRMSPAGRNQIEKDLAGLKGLAGRPGQDFTAKKAADIHARLFGTPSAPASSPAAGVTPRAPLPAGTAAHVQHAAAVAHRSAPGAGVAKRQVEAYGKLSKAEFDALPDDTRTKIEHDLHSAHAKFLDPAKRAEVGKIRDRLGVSPTAAAPSAPPAAPHAADLKTAQGEALGRMMAALGSATGTKAATDAVRRGHDNLQPGQKLSQAPGMGALISGMADEVQKRHNQRNPGVPMPSKSTIAEQIANHLDAGGAGLPSHVEAVADKQAPVAVGTRLSDLRSYHGNLTPGALKDPHIVAGLAHRIDAADRGIVSGTPERAELERTLREISEDQKVPLWIRGYAHNLAHPAAPGARVRPDVQMAIEAATETPGPHGYFPTTAKLGYLYNLPDDQFAKLHPTLQEAIKARRSEAVYETFRRATTDAAKESTVLTVLGGDVPPDADGMKRYHELSDDAKSAMVTYLGRLADDGKQAWPVRLDAQARQDALRGIKHSPDVQRLAGIIGSHASSSPVAYDAYRNLDPATFQKLPAVYREGIKAHLVAMSHAGLFGIPGNTDHPFPTEIVAKLEGRLPNYPPHGAKYRAVVAATVNRGHLSAAQRANEYLVLGNPDVLSKSEQKDVLDDMKTVASDPSVALSDRHQVQMLHDKASGDWARYSAAQKAVALGDSPTTSGVTPADRIQSYAALSKSEYDALPKAYRDSIDAHLSISGDPAAAKLTAKFHPAVAAASPAGAPTVSSDPKIQAALDVLYGIHPKHHTAAHQMATYGALRKSQFDQLSLDEQSTLLGDLSYIATTSKGTNADKASKLIDRFTPAGTPLGTIPSQTPIPPASSVSGQHRVPDPAGTPGLMKMATDSGRSGDGWTRKTDGSRGPWGQYGAAGVMLRHVGADGKTRYLMIERGPGISDPGKWQFPGGAIDSKETPHQGATRETIEELGFPKGALDDARVHGEHVYSIHGVQGAPNGGEWRYTTIAATVPHQIQPDLSTHHARAETSDAKWMTAEEIEELDRKGKLLSPLAGGKLQQNVMSLFPATGPGAARPGPRTTKPPRLRPAQAKGPHKPSRGKNLVADKASIDALRQQIKQDRKAYEGKTADARLAAIGARQGYDDTPTVLPKSEVDRLLATGDYIEVWRGVRGTGRKSAKEINDELRHGPAYYGTGVFGNGYYFATQRSVADKYSDGTRGSVVRVLIPKSAVIAPHEDMIKEARKVGTPQTKAKGARWEPSTLYDEGRYAAAKGVDGIEIKHTSGAASGMRAGHVAAPGRPAYNWLNRSVLIVQED